MKALARFPGLLWIPALWALALEWHAGPFSFTPAYLVIPLAALLGQRYGRRALWLVAIGGAPLAPPLVTLGFLALTSALDVYVVALAACALAADERPLAEQVPQPIGLPLFAAALVMLPLAMSIWGAEVGALKIRMTFGLVAILWLVLFLLGWGGFPARRAVAGLAIATAVGMCVDAVVPRNGATPFLELTGSEHLWWDYRLDSPAAFLAGVTYFFAGHLWGAMLRTRADPLPRRSAYALVLSVAALALGYTVNRAVLVAMGFEWHPLVRHGFVIGAPLALPVTGLLAGLLLGRRGVAVAVLAVPAFWVLDAFTLSGFRLPLQAFPAGLHQPLCVLGFGLIGLAVRNRVLGTEAPWQPPHWGFEAVRPELAKFGFRALKPRDGYA